MPAWTTLSEPEYKAVWDRFESEFRFRPSVSAFPGIDEPTPSRTYALAGEWTDADVDEFYGGVLVALRAGCRRGDRL